MNTTTIRATLLAAAIAASSLCGVASATANNSLQPDASASGDAVAQRVTAAVRDLVGSTSPEITAAYRDGEVTLTGWARNASDLGKARIVAASTPGVKKVYATAVHLWSNRTDTDF